MTSLPKRDFELSDELASGDSVGELPNKDIVKCSQLYASVMRMCLCHTRNAVGLDREALKMKLEACDNKRHWRGWLLHYLHFPEPTTQEHCPRLRLLNETLNFNYWYNLP
jgi:hypothetical protein